MLVGSVKNQVAKSVHCGLHGYRLHSSTSYSAKLETQSDTADLGRFSQQLEPTEHFCGQESCEDCPLWGEIVI